MLRKRPTNEAKRVSAMPAKAMTITPQTIKGDKELHPFTHEIEFLGVGVSEKRGKFLLVQKGDKHAVLSVRALKRQPQDELERLEALDVDLILNKAQAEFLVRAQEAVGMPTTFKVATQIGWFGDVFVLPRFVYPQQPPIAGMPKGWSRVLVHLDAKDDDVHSRYRCYGERSGSKEIFRLCGGNSRLMFAAALSFVGPCCKPFGLRPPGVQAVGDAASGKTVFGIIAGATNGGVPDSTIGFGSAWNGTPNGLEEYAPAHNQTLMVLDETSLMPTDDKGRALPFGEALMRLAQGQGKKRSGRGIERWSATLVSTSNFSVCQLLDAKRREQYMAYVDRLIDIPAPNGSTSFFENLHDFKDADAFGQHLFDLATRNFGHPLHAFLLGLTRELSKDRGALAAVVAANVAKYKTAAAEITSPVRGVSRVCGYFATVYAAGCLARRYNILPFKRPELLKAIMSCHRDHVAFVDAEVARLSGRTMPPQPAIVAQGVVAGVAVPAGTPFEKVRKFVNDSRRKGFHNLRRRPDGRPRGMPAKTVQVLGYLGEHGGWKEFWIPNPTFQQNAGGERESDELKRELLGRGLIVVSRRGNRVSYVVKRKLPDGRRPNFVVLRYPTPDGRKTR